MKGSISVIVVFQLFQPEISLSCNPLMYLPLWHLWKAGDSDRANGCTVGKAM